VDRPLEPDGRGYSLDGIPIEEEELIARAYSDPSASATTRSLARSLKFRASRSIKVFVGSMVVCLVIGYLLYLTLRGDLWIWMLSMALIGFIIGIIAFSVTRAEANLTLAMLADSYNRDRGYAPLGGPEEDHDTDDDVGY
jgi:hypothetical protein